jgi:hypothetical protein
VTPQRRARIIRDAIRSRCPSGWRLVLISSAARGWLADLLAAEWRPWPDLTAEEDVAQLEAAVRALFAGLDGAVAVVVFPSPVDRLHRWRLQRLEMALTEGLHQAWEAGARIVAVSGEALDHAPASAFAPAPGRLAARARELLERIQSARTLELVQGAARFSLPSRGWEVETTDLSVDRLTQLPGGEAFVHFECAWDGELKVASPDGARWRNRTVLLQGGRIRNVRAGRRCVAEQPLGALVGEIGIGANSAVALEPAAWGEKADLVLHLGLGTRMGEDLAPPSVHSDLLLPNAHLMVDGTVLS